LAVTEALSVELLRLVANTLLPTELQLSRRFGVSRVTARQALGVLERGGLVSRQRGRGTTVSRPKVVRSLTPVSNLEEDLARQGLHLDTELVRFEHRHSAPPEVLALLDPDARADVGFLALPIEMAHLETLSPTKPLCCRGVGESSLLPTAVAVAAAVEDVLRDRGLRVDRMPLTAPRLRELIRTGGE
jgi:GntR family transcriptional regulator